MLVSLRCSCRKKTSLMQRSKGFGHRVVVSKICYVQYSDCVQGLGYRVLYWLCSQLWLVTAANQWTIVEIDKIETLASVGWKWGCQPFSCPCSLNVMHFRKEICLTCLSKESMPFVKSKPPLPTRSLRSLRAAVCSTNSALCCMQIMLVSCPSLRCSCRRKIRLMQRSKGFGHGVFVVSMSAAKKAFSLCGLEVGLPAFQLTMFAKCEALPKGDLFDMFV